MKKLIVILLTALLLCGCGDKVQIKDINIGGSNIKETNIDDSSSKQEGELFLILRFTINPEFELYLDENMLITVVRCCNEDAKALFTELRLSDVVGKEYETAVETILHTAKDKAFITAETDQIQIQTSVVAEMVEDKEALEALAGSLAQPVETFQENNDLTFTVVSETPVLENPIEEENSGDYYTGKPNSQKNQKIYDGLKSVGNLISYYDENGKLYQQDIEIFGEKTGTYLYDTDGNVIESRSVFADGLSITTLYDTDGNRTEVTTVSKDGTTNHTTYRPDGTMIKEETTLSDHTATTLYDEAGNKTETTSLWDNGNSCYVTYRPDGTQICWEETLSDSTLTRDYNEEDLPILETRIFHDGRITTTTYHPNGEEAIIHEENPSDGSCSDNIYDENGQFISAVHMYADGSKYETTYYPGTYIPQWECQIYADVSTERFYTEDGSVTKSISTSQSGSTETTFHSNGKEAVVIFTGSESSSEIHYDENGNMIYLYRNDGFSEYVIENGFFTYYLENGEPVTDEKYLQDVYNALKQAGAF